MVYFSPQLLRELEPYTKEGERSGFLELTAHMMLALESIADHLAVSCRTLDDLRQLAQDTGCLGLKLWQRVDAANEE